MSSKKVLYSVASAAAFVGLVWLLCRETPQAPPPHVQKKHIRPSNDKAYDECTRALQIPKVALLFLAHQDIQQKPVWRSWLKQAVRVVGHTTRMMVVEAQVGVLVPYASQHPHRSRLRCCIRTWTSIARISIELLLHVEP